MILFYFSGPFFFFFFKVHSFLPLPFCVSAPLFLGFIFFLFSLLFYPICPISILIYPRLSFAGLFSLPFLYSPSPPPPVDLLPRHPPPHPSWEMNMSPYWMRRPEQGNGARPTSHIFFMHIENMVMSAFALLHGNDATPSAVLSGQGWCGPKRAR